MVNIEQIQKDLDTGVMVGRVTIAALVKYAAKLKEQRDTFVEKCAELHPEFKYDSNGPDYKECPCCGATAIIRYVGGNRQECDALVHDQDCPHLMAVRIQVEEA